MLIALQGLLFVLLLVQRQKRRTAEASARMTSDRNRQLAADLISAQEEERTRIARELHDDVGQRLASLSIALSGVKRKIGDRNDGAGDELSALQRDIMRLSRDLRDLSHTLHPGALEHVGLVEALKTRCEELSLVSAVKARVKVDTWSEVPYDVAVCLYRVAQEALHNVATHAHASCAEICVARQDGRVVMRVTDNGRGFDPTAATVNRGLGLLSMGERVRMLGGTLSVQTIHNAGTAIVTTLPIGERS
jgi:signal transduction histidine kinase